VPAASPLLDFMQGIGELLRAGGGNGVCVLWRSLQRILVCVFGSSWLNHWDLCVLAAF